MVKEGRYVLLSRVASGAAVALFLAGCATDAVELPPMGIAGAETPGVIALNCQQLKAQQEGIRQKIHALELPIQESRRQNQTLGYFTTIGLVPLVAGLSLHEEEREQIALLQREWDRLYQQSRALSCYHR